MDAEGRILLCQTLKGKSHLLLVSLGLGLYGYGDNRIRELHLLEDDRMIRIAEGIAGGCGLEADCGNNLACAYFLDLLALVGMEENETSDTLRLVLGGVQHAVAAVHNA